MRVFVYPEKTWENRGARRWQLSWEQLRDTSKAHEEIDFDLDLINMFANFPSVDRARDAAKKILASGKPFFGSITLTEQIVDWFVKEDKVAEWCDCGQAEEIS